jgi:protein-tyrosine sulfotransferase
MRFSNKHCIYITLFLIIYWIVTAIMRARHCAQILEEESQITVIELNRKKSDSNIYISNDVNNLQINDNKKRKFLYNRYLPIVFISGVSGSGLSLMCKLLDEDSNIRCSDSGEFVSEMIIRHDEWTNSKIEKERLLHASMTDDVIDGAVIAFILDMILKQGKIASRICNKDNLILNHAVYIKKLFPNVKFLFMIRDARSTSNTIVNKRIKINGAKIDDHKEALINWNKAIEKMHSNCAEVGFNTCKIVYYEKLLLEPEKMMNQVYEFINQTNVFTRDTPENKIIIDKKKLTDWFGRFPSDLSGQLFDLAPYFKKLGYEAQYFNNYTYLLRKNLQ